VTGLAFLGAEIDFDSSGNASVAWPNWDAHALKLSGRPVSVVLRVGAFLANDQSIPLIRRTAAELLQRLYASGIPPQELQIDYDCPQFSLRGYCVLLSQLRAELAPLPVRPTVLPSWLSEPDFVTLAKQSGAYVLQVHATQKPRIDAAETALCETDDARKWVEKAARIGVPFRVALPTYTYLVAFSPSGALLGIEAEGARRAWPPGTVLRAFRPDPARVAALIRDWIKDRPAKLVGLLWYRLPVSTDTLNWHWSTLAAVIQGRPPLPKLQLEQSGASPTDLVLVNSGEADAALPARIVATSASSIAAADGIGGYHAETSPTRTLFLRDEQAAIDRIPPGGRRAIGWLRSNAKLSIQYQ
jgi:hypothetical protein